MDKNTKEVINTTIVIVGAILMMAIIASAMIDKEVHNHYPDLNLTETIDLINENCGGTYLTKKYGEEDWYVFKQVCKEGHFCKYDYIKLSDCMGTGGVEDE